MKYEEYKALIDEAMGNVDKAPANFVKVLEALKADTTTAESLRATNAEQERRIRDLQDTNAKLFLSVTNGEKPEPEPEPEPEKTPDEVKAEFIEKIKMKEVE